MSHAAAWQRDDMRLADLMPRVATLPLGSGALAGNPFLVDRQFIAKELGMVGGVCPNSMDAVSDREWLWGGDVLGRGGGGWVGQEDTFSSCRAADGINARVYVCVIRTLQPGVCMGMKPVAGLQACHCSPHLTAPRTSPDLT